MQQLVSFFRPSKVVGWIQEGHKRKFQFASGVTLGLILLALIFPWQPVRVYTGPKPSMPFTIEYAIDPPPELIGGFMMTCSDPNCTEGQVFSAGLILPFH